MLLNMWKSVDPHVKMSWIVSRAFILFTDVKEKRFACNFLEHCCQKFIKKDKIYIFSELK